MHEIEIDATLKLAKAKLRAGQVAEAEGMYRKVLSERPSCAEAVHFLGLSALQRGKLEAALEMVSKSIELEPNKADYHNNLASVRGRMGRSIEALGSAQRAIDLQADFAEAYGNKGVALEQLGRLDEAIEAYRKAVELKADNADALCNLGNGLSRKGEHEEAIKHLKKFVELRPRDANGRKHLGNALRRAGTPEPAVTAYRMAVELNPKDADAYNNLGAALQESGRVPEAEEVLRTCLSINPNHSDAHWNRGLALLAMGQWREGWMEYEWREHLKQDVGQKRNFPQPVWKGSPLEGRTILVLCEQGLGDSIQFVRYVPMLAARGAKVIVECQAKLKPLFLGLCGAEGKEAHAEPQGRREENGENGNGHFNRQSQIGIRQSDISVIAKGEPIPNFDMHARLLTLPGIFDSTPDDLPNRVPYLHVDDKRVQRLRRVLDLKCDAETRGHEDGSKGDAGTRGHEDAGKETLGSFPASSRPGVPASSSSLPASPRPRVPASSLTVGLVWQGNTAHKGDRFRSIPLSKFAPLAQVPGIRLVSLQKGFGSEQIESCKEQVPLVEWSDPQDTTAEALLDTAAMMKCLDLVIAVDTSVAHLAGALGVPTWVAMSLSNDWRWLLDREDTPWYPTLRLFRQRDMGDWDEVIAGMADALRNRGPGKDEVSNSESEEARETVIA